MRYVRLGSSGLQVSAVIVGCLSFGDSARGRSWALDEESTHAVIGAALDAGITAFDTGNVYASGTSEEYVGRALRSLARREDIVISTKVRNRMRPGPYGVGLSRKAILHEIDESLRRLGTDYVDVYQIHRWDTEVPIEETMEALDDVVRAGKARYLGASSMRAWQFAKAQSVARENGWTSFVSMQNHYNLLYREEEWEMLPLCRDLGVGVIPWSPVARGHLTRPWGESTRRSVDDPKALEFAREEDRFVVEAVGAVADRRGVSRAQVALAWVMHQPGVAAPIVGFSRPDHLTEAVDAADLELSEAELEELTKPYVPRAPEDYS